MRFDQIRKQLTDFTNAKPTLEQALDFLTQSVVGDVPMYISGPGGFYVYGIVAPADLLQSRGMDEMVDWNFAVPSGWSYGYRLDEKPEDTNFFIAPPLEYSGSEILGAGQPIFFLRDFPGVGSHVEINQKLSHLLNIHQRITASRHVYQRLDDNGDFQDAVIIEHDPSIICTVQLDDLEQLALLLDSVPIRVFDILTTLGEYPSDTDRQNFQRYSTPFGDEIIYWGGPIPGIDSSYIRGFQLLTNKAEPGEVARRLRGEQIHQYVSFIALDWKHGQIRECSCDPDQLGNYFVESDLPYETSPAFFRPEVLLKYRQDPDKYRIENGRIRCRGTWELPYDINDTGQLHVYLVDLSRLPFNEQLYWKSFNEEPTSGISARAYARDFEGRWASFETPLDSLKKRLRDFPSIELDGDDLNEPTI